MNKRKDILFGVAALFLLGYGAWTTAHISQLQARLARLEASHLVLGRYTFDFGAALTDLSKWKGQLTQVHGPSGPEMARIVLMEMLQDELTRPAVASSRTRQVLIGGRYSPHNSLEKVIP